MFSRESFKVLLATPEKTPSTHGWIGFNLSKHGGGAISIRIKPKYDLNISSIVMTDGRKNLVKLPFLVSTPIVSSTSQGEESETSSSKIDKTKTAAKDAPVIGGQPKVISTSDAKGQPITLKYKYDPFCETCLSKSFIVRDIVVLEKKGSVNVEPELSSLEEEVLPAVQVFRGDALECSISTDIDSKLNEYFTRLHQPTTYCISSASDVISLPKLPVPSTSFMKREKSFRFGLCPLLPSIPQAKLHINNWIARVSSFSGSSPSLPPIVSFVIEYNPLSQNSYVQLSDVPFREFVETNSLTVSPMVGIKVPKIIFMCVEVPISFELDFVRVRVFKDKTQVCWFEDSPNTVRTGMMAALTLLEGKEICDMDLPLKSAPLKAPGKPSQPLLPPPRPVHLPQGTVPPQQADFKYPDGRPMTPQPQYSSPMPVTSPLSYARMTSASFITHRACIGRGGEGVSYRVTIPSMDPPFCVLKVFSVDARGNFIGDCDNEFHKLVKLYTNPKCSAFIPRPLCIYDTLSAPSLPPPEVVSVPRKEAKRKKRKMRKVASATLPAPSPLPVGEYGFLMELCAGGDVARFCEWWAQDNSLRIASICYQMVVCLANVFAASSRVVHKDIKPQNFLVSIDQTNGNCFVKVGDLGMSQIASTRALTNSVAGCLFDEDEDFERERESMVKQASKPVGGPAGTINFFSPEVLRAQPATQKSDAWALGLCIFSLFAKDTPFLALTRMGRDAIDQFRIVREEVLVHGNIPRLSACPLFQELMKDYPRVADKLVEVSEGLLKVDPSERWSAQEAFMRFREIEGYLPKIVVKRQ
ncbi:hypothetical protein ADUPG1_008842 [Aduncisulcus paluster]|uniref:non-specific serine/threonine protein kinase n=1 Tax=Aduncisulcus paluster TaxID=2918883 RepID=A0ABQ5KTF5_9EUKA|nr:hypothetical protein ADUPG1_008842 [Aduncisulcus paluster]